MRPVLNLLRSLLAVVVGYLVLVALITLVQEVWFGGVGFYKSSLTVLVVAGFFTFLSAAAGGSVTVLIAKSHRRMHALALCSLIVAEAIALIVTEELQIHFGLIPSPRVHSSLVFCSALFCLKG